MEKTSRRRKYIGKHVKPTDENIMQLLMPSILGMLICMVCLAGATWAWFTATTTVSAPPVSAAYFGVDVTINDGEKLKETNTKYEYNVSANVNQEIKLTATGNASIGGYCVITVGEDTYYTPWMSIEENGDNHTISFKLYTDKETIKIVPYWGIPSNDGDNKIINNGQIGEPPASNGDTSETPDENTGGAASIGGGETGGSDNSTANNDNAGNHNASQSEQPSLHPANEDKGDSSDNNSGISSDSADTTPAASDNTAGGSHDSTSASSSDSGSTGSSDSGSSGSDSGSSSSVGGSSSGGGESSGNSGGGESSGGGIAGE